MANIIIKMSGQLSKAVVAASLKGAPKQSLRSFLSSLPEAMGSSQGMQMQLLNDDAVVASGTITIADVSKVTANDTYQIGGLVLTAKASGASTNEFNIGVSETATALALANAINLYSTVVRARSALGVCTIRAVIAGTMGNQIALSLVQTDSGGATVSAASLASGIDDTGVSKDYKSF